MFLYCSQRRTIPPTSFNDSPCAHSVTDPNQSSNSVTLTVALCANLSWKPRASYSLFGPKYVPIKKINGKSTVNLCEKPTVFTRDDHPKLEYDHLRREFTRQIGIRDHALPGSKSGGHIRVLAEPAGRGHSVKSQIRPLALRGTHWTLNEYWVKAGGSGCVLTTNSVIIPNDAAAPFSACQLAGKS